jgi:hypothetical protein
MMGGVRNTGSGGPRFVVAGRDRARPSSGAFVQYSTIPQFHYSICKFQIIANAYKLVLVKHNSFALFSKNTCHLTPFL